MPVVGIVVSYVGASVGTAAFAGTALAGFGSAIGAGIAGGLYASSQGGDFGKGFLMSAVGNYIGNQLGEAFGGAGGAADDAFMAADAAQLAEQGLSAGAIGQNMGAAAGNWSGVNAMSGMGDIASGASTGMGEYAMSDAEFAASTGYPQANTMDVGATTSGMDTPDIGGPYQIPGSTTGYEGSPWLEPNLDAQASFNGVDLPKPPATLENTYGNIDPQSSYPGSGGPDLSSGGLENITSSAPASGGNPAGDFGTPTQSGGYMDRLKGWVSDSDASLAKYGMPKGSTVLGLAGMGQYMMGNYKTYKAEQIAKGMKPLTLEEFQNKMYNPNDYKTAANSMTQSGRTGTLPALLARMKQQSSMDYTKNYQPTANNNWWNVNANISNQRMNNLGNLTQPLSMAWAMNQGKR